MHRSSRRGLGPFAIVPLRAFLFGIIRYDHEEAGDFAQNFDELCSMSEQK